MPDLLSYYDDIWQKNWHNLIVITGKDVTQERYKALGKKMIETYYQRYAPFDIYTTIQSEMWFDFALDKKSQYRMIDYIDQLSCTADGTYQIHDYETSAYLLV